MQHLVILPDRIPTLAEVLQLVGERAAAGERGGAYLETKEPSFHDAKGLPLEAAVVAELTAAGFKGDMLAQRIVLQSFEEQVGWVGCACWSDFAPLWYWLSGNAGCSCGFQAQLAAAGQQFAPTSV